MAQTKLSNLINPEVMADMISAELPNKIKFAPLARIDSTLAGQPGNTITVPKYAYIGDAEDVAEGVAMGTTILTSSSTQATVKKAGKAVEITDESALSGFGDPVGNANDQLLKSIAAKVDNDSVTALGAATLTHAAGAVVSYNAIVDAIDKFEEEDDEAKILFIHPLQKGTLRKDPNFIANVPNAFMSGVIGEIAGCQVVASGKVPADATTYTNFIVKQGALDIYLKRDVQVETDRDILKKSTVISADEHYTVVLADDSKVVKLTTNK
ncbi:N4-gp56 family major capsid protein [Priestia megaterium]|uniref:N4-gp56 family major capsid protein n=1 Tax=Priestia megaterium TaxID=1404 RepID=UPI003CC5087B